MARIDSPASNDNRSTRWILRMDNLLKATDISSLKGARRCHDEELSRAARSVRPHARNDSGHRRKVIGLGPEIGDRLGPESALTGYVCARDKGCIYCTRTKDLQADHVIAKSKGGSDRQWNRVAACRSCNKSKDDKPLEARLDGDAPGKVKQRGEIILKYVSDVSQGLVKLDAMAAENIVGPCLVKKLEADRLVVVKNSAADTTGWRRMRKLEKSQTIDAACTATQGAPMALRCERTLRVRMTGRGRRLVVARDKHGMPRRKNDGTPVAHHRARPPHDFRAGDIVALESKDGHGGRRIAALTTARHDGRLVALLRNGQRINIMASRATLIHRTLGAIIQ